MSRRVAPITFVLMLWLSMVRAQDVDPRNDTPRRQQSPPKAALAAAPNVPVFGVMSFPEGFVPTAGRPPSWLLGGSEIAVIGKRGDTTEILSFGGPRFNARKLVATDS